MDAQARWFCKSLPGYEEKDITGKLIVLEGSDQVDRAELARSLKRSLHEFGLPVKDSIPGNLGVLAAQLRDRTSSLGPKAAALAQATIITEELESVVLPALQANFTVITNSYIYSCFVDSIITGVHEEWLRHLYSRCLVPDLVFFLDVPPEVLVERRLLQTEKIILNFAEDKALYDSLLCHEQTRRSHFKKLSEQYGFVNLDGTRDLAVLGREVVDIAAKLFPVED